MQTPGSYRTIDSEIVAPLLSVARHAPDALSLVFESHHLRERLDQVAIRAGYQSTAKLLGELPAAVELLDRLKEHWELRPLRQDHLLLIFELAEVERARATSPRSKHKATQLSSKLLSQIRTQRLLQRILP